MDQCGTNMLKHQNQNFSGEIRTYHLTSKTIIILPITIRGVLIFDNLSAIADCLIFLNIKLKHFSS